MYQSETGFVACPPAAATMINHSFDQTLQGHAQSDQTTTMLAYRGIGFQTQNRYISIFVAVFEVSFNDTKANVRRHNSGRQAMP